jgi:ribosomal protein S18 acetylase RimI-like enzyme
VAHDLEFGDFRQSRVSLAREGRRQGLARELITAARDRAFREGFPQVRLATDSNTGALEVYQHLGMTLDRSFTHWAIDLN